MAPELLMLRPAHFGWNSETGPSNAFQIRQPHSLPAQTALQGLREFDAMHRRLLDTGLRVTVLADRDDVPCPDAVFLNNLFCTLPDGGLVHFPMEAPSRRLEKRHDLAHLLIEAGFRVAYESDWSDWAHGGQYLEGTGSLVLDHTHRWAYAAFSTRTSPELFERWCGEMGYQGFGFQSRDTHGQPYYHTNVVMSLGQNLALVGCDAVDSLTRQELRHRLEQSGRDVLELNPDQIACFGANVLQVLHPAGHRCWIASETAIKAWGIGIRQRVEADGELVSVSLTTIEKTGGGSARCMLAENYLPLL
ncbi:MAG: arginine deiminase-related protein [Bacteroidota bacterium]